MHRTQVMIEDKHYAFLKEKAKHENKSISQILRELLDNCTKKSNMYSLSSLAGILEDEECSGKDHDKWIYGK